MSAPGMPRRLRIDRLDLSLRGVAPATADAAARSLGPALARALASATIAASPEGAQRVAGDRRLDAGRIVTDVSPGASDLAAAIADRIARTIRGEGA